MKDEQVSLPKPQSQLEQLHDDDEDVFATRLIDRYGEASFFTKHVLSKHLQLCMM